MLFGARLVASRVVLISLSLCLVAFAGIARAASIGPDLEQEFNDAKAALDLARRPHVEHYAATQLKQAQDSLQAAAVARQTQDATSFGRSARIARAYADLARAMADSSAAADRSASSSAALQKAKLEIQQLTKPK